MIGTTEDTTAQYNWAPGISSTTTAPRACTTTAGSRLLMSHPTDARPSMRSLAPRVSSQDRPNESNALGSDSSTTDGAVTTYPQAMKTTTQIEPTTSPRIARATNAVPSPFATATTMPDTNTHRNITRASSRPLPSPTRNSGTIFPTPNRHTSPNSGTRP